MVLWLALAVAAWGQATRTDRPTVPAGGLAAENGPGALWVNPANLAYDPDVRFAAFFSQDLEEDGRTAFAGTYGMGGLSVGAYNLLRQDGLTDWSLDLASGIQLPKRIAVGIRLDWHLVPDSTNFVAWDVGASWRPLPWLGFSGVAWNIAGPSPTVVARSGFGLAFRPFGDAAVIGVDYLRAFDPETEPLPDDIPRETYILTARLRPVEGFYIRGSLDSQLTVGAGVELYFGGYGGGAFGVRADDGRWGLTATLGTDEPGESLVRSGHRVPSIDLRAMPPEQPKPKLIGRAEPGWLDVLELLRRLEDDKSVRGAAITLGPTPASWGHWQELRGRIASLEASGKRVAVYLYGDAPAGAYFAASAASRVYLHPAGSVDLVGPGAELLYVGGTLDWLGIDAQVARRSQYKSASEPLTDTEPSPEQLEQMQALLGDIEDELVSGIAEGRGIDPSVARSWVEEGPWTAQQALDKGLVDVLGYPDELDRPLHELYGFNPNMPSLLDTPQPHSPWEAPSQIAVISIEDAIVGGPSGNGGPLGGGNVTGSGTVVKLLQKAAEAAEVRAVLLRIDSPGGSAFASDEIWYAVRKVREQGKPVVASLGGTAASGGYYIASAADEIYAEPTTVTGSIGVIVTKVSAGPALERLGATVTPLSTSRHADLESRYTAWDPIDEAKMQEQVDATYERFLAHVAEGRHTTRDAIEQVAGGRVWSAKAAADHGLVDGLGGFEQAVAQARTLAGIRPNRKVLLVSYTAGGLPVRSLAPTVIHALGPLPLLATAFHPEPAQPVLPEPIAQLLAPLTMWATLADQGVLLFDPLVLEVQPR